MLMQKITLSALRRNLFQIVDAVLAGSKPIEIERHGRRLRLIPDDSSSKLSRLRPRALIKGSAEDLATMKAARWRTPN